jgi:DNA polymerase I
MLNLSVCNIFNIKNTIYLWHRVAGKLCLFKDSSFYPYYFEKAPAGIFRGYDGARLIKKTCQDPYQVSQRRTLESYESDIIFTKRYLIDKISITKCPIRWIMLDIEVLTKEFPNAHVANKPISYVTAYDNFDNEYKQWCLDDAGIGDILVAEQKIKENLIVWIKSKSPDLIIMWNAYNFDYLYLCNRWTDFPERISPIGKRLKRNNFPAGISIIDYLAWDKKISHDRRKSYALEYVAQEELGTPLKKKIDFSIMSEDLKQRNFEDVHWMVEIEKKKNYIPLFNDIRILSKCLWEDMEWNSKIVDCLLLQEAKKLNVILPKKPEYQEEGEVEVEGFEGAFRFAFEIGRFTNLGKYDLGSAYMFAITDLCLDSTNIMQRPEGTTPVRITDRETNEIKEILNIRQNSNALLPTLARKLIAEKTRYKELKKNTNPESPEYKDVEGKYEAIKAIFLSAWGCIGNRGFRLFNPKIAGTITSIPRDLIHYVNDELKKLNYKVIYSDTDSCFIQGGGIDLSEKLNTLIQQWSQERFGKKSSIQFEYEGNFESIFIIQRCHYKGWLRQKSGLKEEIKGIEGKRKDSTIFMADYQISLIDKVLKGESREQCLEFTKQKLIEIEKSPLENIAMPCKIAPNKEYKNEPIFARALRYTKEIVKDFDPRPGENFYWIYVKPFGIEEKPGKKTVKGIIKDTITKKQKEVIAFDLEHKEHIKNIDWQKMKERNIFNKAETVFNAMQWDITNLIPVVVKKERKKKVEDD